MAEQMKIVIEVDAANAKATIAGVEQGLKGVESQAKNTSASVSTFSDKLSEIAKGAAAFYVLERAISASVKSAMDYQAALTGLASTARFAGQDMAGTISVATQITSDGLMSTTEAATALKNLLSRGFSTDEAVAMITRFKDSAAFGRQASLQFGAAVVSATEGIKNENSILVDNAGVTKNVAKMWEDYAKAHNTTTAALTMDQKRQAEYNGIMKETAAQIGNARIMASGAAGDFARMNKAVEDSKVAFGQAMLPVVSGLANGLTTLTEKAVKPLIFLFQSLGVTAGETSMIIGASVDFITDPKQWSAAGVERLEKKFKAFSELAEKMRVDLAKKLDTPMAPNIGADSGARRAEEKVAKDADIAAAKRRADAIAQQIAGYEKLENAANRAHLGEKDRMEAEHQEKIRLMDEELEQFLKKNPSTIKAKEGDITVTAENPVIAAHRAAKEAIIAQHEWEMAQLEDAEAIKADFAILKRTDALNRLDQESRAVQRNIDTGLLGLDIEHLKQRGDFQIASLDAEKARLTDAGVWTEEREQAYQERRAGIIEYWGARTDQIRIDQINKERDDRDLEFAELEADLNRKGELTVEKGREFALKRVEATRQQTHALQAIDDAAMDRQRTNKQAQLNAQNRIEKNAANMTAAIRKGDYMDAIKIGAMSLSEGGKTNKKMFEMMKAYNLAKAVMNIPTAVSNALASGPPPWNFVQAAIVGAMGAAQVAAIASSQFSGGGGGAGASAPSAGASAPSAGASAPSPFPQAAPTQSPSLNITVNAPAGLVDPIVAQQLADSLAPHFRDSFRRGLSTSMVMA